MGDLSQRIPSVRKNLVQIFQTIDHLRGLRQAGGNQDGVALVAVSKGQPVELMQVVYEQGVRDFGESYVDEWQEKRLRMPNDVRWHFIGRLQSRKAREVVGAVSLIHSVDRGSLLRELGKRCETRQDVLIQVHLGDDPNKGGVLRSELTRFAEAVVEEERLRLRGVMAIPPYSDALHETRRFFKDLRAAYQDLQSHFSGQSDDLLKIDTCSMGMSSDYATAIEEGATLVRIGSGLFGKRQ